MHIVDPMIVVNGGELGLGSPYHFREQKAVERNMRERRRQLVLGSQHRQRALEHVEVDD